MALTECNECGENISKKAEKCPKCGAPQKKKTSMLTWIVAIILFFWIYSYFSDTPSTQTDAKKSTNAQNTSSPRKIAISNTELEFSWSKGGFDSVMEANFTIKNNSEYEIKDIEITCTHYAKSGTRIDSNKRTIYDVIPARSMKIFEKFNMGFIHSQAEKTNCVVTDLEV